MKRAKSEGNDWLRPEYRRSDLGEIVRGKYARRLGESSNIVVLDPQVAKAFPNDDAVNTALRGLLELARSSVHVARRSTRKAAKRVHGSYADRRPDRA
jgi:hypothetical protein